MYNSYKTLTWKGIHLTVYFDYRKPEPQNDWPGGIDDIGMAITLDSNGEETNFDLWPFLREECRKALVKAIEDTKDEQ